MKALKTITCLDDIKCTHCIFYRNDYDIDRCTCHISPIAFETLPESYCADGLFLYMMPPEGNYWTLNIQDAILNVLSQGTQDEPEHDSALVVTD